MTTAKAMHTTGFEAGEAWAREAKKSELLRLQEHAKENNAIPHAQLFTAGESAHSAYEGFYFCIDPDGDGARSAAVDFWESLSVVEDCYTDDGFMEGFTEGALSVAMSVK